MTDNIIRCRMEYGNVLNEKNLTELSKESETARCCIGFLRVSVNHGTHCKCRLHGS